MKNKEKLIETLKQAAQTTCDKCGRTMEYDLNGYLVELGQLTVPTGDFEEINDLMRTHECSWFELAAVYESMKLTSDRACGGCVENAEYKRLERELDNERLA